MRLGVIGMGNMGTAIVRGAVTDGGVDPRRVIVADPRDEVTARARADLLVGVAVDNSAVVNRSDVVVVAVKPQLMRAVVEPLGGLIGPEHLVVSVAAGVSTASLEAWLGGSARVARVMPNTPCLIAAGASGYCLGTQATESDASTVEGLFSAVGVVARVPERLMDAVTAVSGSGPAWFFRLMEALEDAAVEVGLERQTARSLVLHTALGAAKLASKADAAPARLREQVTSPGGTTAAGLASLDEAGFGQVVREAVVAARDRGRELGESA